MTRAQLRLDLIRIVHHNGREPRHTLEIVREYEKAFTEEGLLEPSAAEPKPSAPAKPRAK